MNDNRGNPRPRNEQDVLARFRGKALDATQREYLEFHARRYVFLLAKVDALEHGRILDIGPSFQTSIMRGIYPESAVDTLGFEDERFARREKDRHIGFDLNDAASREKWPAVGEAYDLAVMAEVLEHVYTAARPVLECVASFLRPGGALIVQTPNAVSLGRRTAMLRGKNPHGMIREERRNPGHFCEFTARELEDAAARAGMTSVETTLTNYFGANGLRGWIYQTLCDWLPGDLRDGITLIARK